MAERDQQLLDIGKQCSHPQCNLIDFLPFKCQHCKESFCQEHYRVEGHRCSKYDETKHNRVAPDCPLCNTPVAVPPGQDPNIRMEQHFEKECSVVTGRVQAKSTPLCAKGTCKKVLFSPIRCDKCRAQFCVSHRFPSDHNCKAASAPTTPAGRQNAAPSRPNLPALSSASSTAKEINAKASVKASEAVNSMKQSLAQAKANTSTAAASASKSMPFNKTDRRAKAERESRIKAMQAREKKGLLSEQEKQILAQYQEEAKKDKDCVIM
ncbi:hypothetical protein CC1G_07148 [Coprinopsis cinerea okayama7|uniref:AN1-type domain-containing protein n=1 Tax=Coprinopsis cinerea (strain Okayama-7 / 130 / ATCC MYA-4618 / FGSC 9003) TaxID=240176 RepID=A8NR87_COPC7|nr:hypothetical protein CC1G_07148 [Coprinopsis cinerea okayama7\|eukprot:XP_001835724.1 hypothetical protein CC1G_07148 [Coprinopsis cinerea okayama7\